MNNARYLRFTESAWNQEKTSQLRSRYNSPNDDFEKRNSKKKKKKVNFFILILQTNYNGQHQSTDP
jgi:hypothetical protein